MQISIKNWRIEPISEADVRLVTFLLGTDSEELPEKIAQIGLTGSVMTQVGDYITAEKDSEAFKSQFGTLAAALLKRELSFNWKAINSPELNFVYTSDDFPFGSVSMPDISSPQDWKFVV